MAFTDTLKKVNKSSNKQDNSMSFTQKIKAGMIKDSKQMALDTASKSFKQSEQDLYSEQSSINNQKLANPFRQEEKNLYEQQAIERQQSEDVARRNEELKQKYPIRYGVAEKAIPILQKMKDIMSSSYVEPTVAAGTAALNFGGLLPKVMQYTPEQTQNMEELLVRNPIASKIGEFGSYILPGTGISKGVGMVTKPVLGAIGKTVARNITNPTISKAVTGAGKVVGSAITEGLAGAGLGATEGLVRGETPDEIYQRAKAFGVGGAVLGGGITALGMAGKPALKYLGENTNIGRKITAPKATDYGKLSEKYLTPSKPVENIDMKNLTQDQFNKMYKLDEPYSIINAKNLVGQVGKQVINKNGTNDLKELVSMYRKKYNLPGIEIKIANQNASYLGETVPKKDLKLKTVGYTIKINPNQTIEEAIGTFRHEIEHIKDLQSGFKGTKELSRLKSIPEGSTLRSLYESGTKGHNKEYGWFEPEYIYKSLKETAQKPNIPVKNTITTEMKLPTIREGNKINTPYGKGTIIKQTQNNKRSLVQFADNTTKYVENKNISNIIKNKETTPTQIVPKLSETPIVNKPKYSPEIESKLKEVDKTLNGKIQMFNAYSDAQLRGKYIKGANMEASAKRREIIQGDKLIDVEGGLTPTELRNKINKLKTNYAGKEVVTPFGEGKTTGKTSFGKSEVILKDGTSKFLESKDINPKTSIEDIIKSQKQKVEKPILKQEEQTSKAMPTPTKELKAKTMQPTKTIKPDAQNIANQLNQINKLEGAGATLERGGSRSTRTDSNMNDDVRKIFDTNPEMYKQMTNEQTIASAQKKFNEGYTKSLTDFMKNDNLGADDIVLSKLLANEAGKRGELDVARDIIIKTAEKLTESGQISQAQSIFRKSDPATFVSYIDKQIKKINDEGIRIYGEKKWKPIKLDNQLEKEIYKLNLYDENIMQQTMERVYNNVQGQMKQSVMNKINGFRRMGMLLNPSTHIANMSGNALLSGARKIDDTLAQGLEKVFLKQEQRTRALGWSQDTALKNQVYDYWKRYGKDISEGGSRYELSNINQLGTMARQNAPLYKNKILEGLNKASFKSLNWEDNIFLSRTFKDTLGQFMKARKLREVTPEAVEYAKNKAYEYTYREMGKFSKLLTSAKNKGNVGSVALETTIPFHRTPINVAKVAYRHSPLGFLTAFSKGKTANQTIDAVAKGLTGSGVVGLGYYLASNGMISMEKMKGYTEYVANTPFGKYTFDWLNPVSVPLAMGLAIKNAVAENEKLNNPDTMSKIWQGFLAGSSAGINAFVDNTIIGTAVDLFKYGDVGKQALDIPQKFAVQTIPRLVQIATKIIDSTPRETKVTAFGKATKSPTLYGEVVSRLPLVSRTLPKKNTKGSSEGIAGQFIPGRKVE